ncbi:hypothetical protein HYS47_04300 [Candidatus Woesearchaeota archaeon]|nr:hypothetical protein [Candidatus Woesearchaeota archaeon]
MIQKSKKWHYSALWFWSIISLFFILVPLSLSEGTDLSGDLNKEQPIPTLTLTVKDITTNQILVSVPAVIEVRNLNSGFQDRVTQYLSSDGVLQYQISPGNWEISLKLYNSVTNEVEYYAERHFNIQKEDTSVIKTFYVTPVGLIEGVVVDSQDNLISNAELDFKCRSEEHLRYPATTDKFGSFRAVLVPAGPCKIFASSQRNVGFAEANILKGQQVSVKIALNQSAAQQLLPPTLQSISIYGYVVGIILLIVIGFIAFYGIRRRLQKRLQRELTEVRQAIETNIEKKLTAKTEKEAPKETANGEEKDSLNPRARDIVKTLNQREKQIIECLLKHNNCASQAVLRNVTGIPKTSLVRSFTSLEAKNIVAVEKIGKMKKVELTPWFLGKD